MQESRGAPLISIIKRLFLLDPGSLDSNISGDLGQGKSGNREPSDLSHK